MKEKQTQIEMKSDRRSDRMTSGIGSSMTRSELEEDSSTMYYDQSQGAKVGLGVRSR